MRSVPCDEVHPRITLVEPSASDGLGQPVSVEVDCGSLATSIGSTIVGSVAGGGASVGEDSTATQVDSIVGSCHASETGSSKYVIDEHSYRYHARSVPSAEACDSIASNLPSPRLRNQRAKRSPASPAATA